MKLTCVTATFNAIAAGNRERLVCCVESVARIDVGHEHLVFDGASTDGTAELLRELAAKHPDLKVVSEPDTGIYNALNKGVRAAQGDWFYVLGSDDEVSDPAEMVRALEDGEGHGADIVSSPVRPSTDPDGVWSGYRNYLFSTMPLRHQGMLMRSDVLRRLGGFDERYRIAADYDLVLRAMQSAVKVRHLAAAYAVFGMEGVSTVSTRASIEECVRIVRERWGLDESEARELMNRNRLPLRVILKSIVHASPDIRRASRYQAARFILDSLGLLKADGTLRLRGKSDRV